ncbi:MAG: M14 family metallopeptidase [Thermogutta sp.]
MPRPLPRAFFGLTRRVGVAVLFAVATTSLPCIAEDLPYPVVGAPISPRVSVAWDRYHDYEEATRLLQEMAAAFPGLCRLESLGPSYQGRELWLLTVTEQGEVPDIRKPGFWLDAGIHANEIQGTEVVLYTAWFLLESFGRNEKITQLLRDRVFYILPMLSPDSRDAHLHTPQSTNTPRGGQVPFDDDRDGVADEDGWDDLDGDGNIALMRVADPNGRYKPHPRFPEWLVPAEPDEPGQYRILGPEGYDNDGDGKINEDPPGNYDPNRNWPWQWQPRYVQGGAILYPLALPENRAAAEFILRHPNIAGAQSFHNFGGMILRGPGSADDTYAEEDIEVFDALASKGEKILPGYRYMVIHKDLYPVFGGELDWLYQMRGVFCFTTELFTPQNYFGQTTDRTINLREEQMREFDRYLLLGQGYVPWKEVRHPQYGKIEVGGAVKSWGRQPPSFMLEEECHRNMAFVLYHADQMPLVRLGDVEVRREANGLLRVTATVENRRVMPTRSAVDRQRRITPPDRVAIEGADSVVLGLISDTPFFENPREQKDRPGDLRVDFVPGMSAVYVRWYVQGRGPLTVSVQSHKGGNDRRELDVSR